MQNSSQKKQPNMMYPSQQQAQSQMALGKMNASSAQQMNQVKSQQQLMHGGQNNYDMGKEKQSMQ